MWRFVKNLLALAFFICLVKCEDCVLNEDVATCEQVKFPLTIDKKVKKLIFKETNLKNLTKNDFEGLDGLEVIVASDTGLEFLAHDTFESLPNLKEVDLSQNKELSLPEQGTFLESSSISKLNLSNVFIGGTLNEEYFDELPSLEELDLSFTDLTSISSEPFKNTHKLKLLYLSKDDSFDLNNLCKETNISQILLLTADAERETFDCSAKTNDDETTKQVVPDVSQQIDKDEENTNSEKPATDEETNADEQQVDVKVNQIEDSKDTNLEEESSGEGIIQTTDMPAVRKASQNEENNQKESPKTAEKDEQNVNVSIANVDDDNDKQDNGGVTIIDNANDMKPDENVVHTSEKHSKESAVGEKQENSGVLDSLNVIPNENLREMKSKNSGDVISEPNADASKPKEAIEIGATPSTASSGTTIILGIIVGVLVVGAAGFGYKYWKNHRGYRHTATEEENPEEGKELQTIVSHKTDNDEQK